MDEQAGPAPEEMVASSEDSDGRLEQLHDDQGPRDTHSSTAEDAAADQACACSSNLASIRPWQNWQSLMSRLRLLKLCLQRNMERNHELLLRRMRNLPAPQIIPRNLMARILVALYKDSCYEGSLKDTGCVSGICMPRPDQPGGAA